MPAIAATTARANRHPARSGSISLRVRASTIWRWCSSAITVDPPRLRIVLYSPLEHANPYYAEFGWVPAAGSTAADFPIIHTVWSRDGSGSLTPTSPR